MRQMKDNRTAPEFVVTHDNKSRAEEACAREQEKRKPKQPFHEQLDENGF